MAIARRTLAPAALMIVGLVGGCGTMRPPFGPGPAPAPETRASDAPGADGADVAAVVVGESGLAAGIPAAIETFGPAPVAARTPEAVPAGLAGRGPTLLPRQLPDADARGEAFADRVSISPDGRRLAVGRQRSRGFEVEVLDARTKASERRHRLRGRLDYLAWADADTIVVGTGRGAERAVQALDAASGAIRVLATRGDGVLTIREDGYVVIRRPGRERFACPGSADLPTAYEGAPVVQAGPPDREGRIVYRTEGAPGALVPFDCEAGAFATPLYEGGAFDGALFDRAGGTYLGVWDADGPRYLDASLAYEMRAVAASFPEGVDVWPIELTRSPNTMLLYVSGPDTAPSYYVLDRYAGALDLVVTYAR